MVLRQLFWLTGGIGLASLGGHVMLTQTLREQRRELSEAFKVQQDLLFHKKLKEFRE